jgi:hypothetical protein
MPGSWELRAANQVQVITLHTDVVSTAWALGLRNLIVPGPPVEVLAGMPYDMSRNRGCQIALDRGCSHVFHLDSDVVPPRDAVLRLLKHNLPIVSGLYCRRSPPHAVPVMMKPVGRWVTHFKPNSLVEVDVVGAGCLLISCDLLRQMKPPVPIGFIGGLTCRELSLTPYPKTLRFVLTPRSNWGSKLTWIPQFTVAILEFQSIRTATCNPLKLFQ